MAAKKKNHSIDLPPQSDPRAPLDGALLLSKAQGLLAELEADLLVRARGSVPVREALRARHESERAARRTADPLEVWERHFVTQVAASWLLSSVFVRTLEDRGLLGHNRIAGPGALDSQRLFFELAPSLTEREYLLTTFRELSRLPAARDLFDTRHNPVWMLGPSAEMAKKLVALFRTPNADAPGLRFGQSDTRFLGDLYQDLSADVRERFALLQTPHFVEKYILDRTLERAIARFGLDETTLIDPTCGSGHFLLGAFERLVDHRLRKEPGLDVREAARKALDSVYGADINPYAVAIARFRLTLAFLDKAGYPRLADAPALPLHLVVADSLLHNPQNAQAKLGEVAGQSMREWEGDEFALEDERAARDVLYRRFAAVVGNPPFSAPRDKSLKELYRDGYLSANGRFTLAAPFVERFFQLARDGGLVGFINASTFAVKRFGRVLLEKVLPKYRVTHIINTAGVYFPPPGFSSPTVIVLGVLGASEEQGDSTTVVVKQVRQDPGEYPDASVGLVWRSIAEHGEEVGFADEFIEVTTNSPAQVHSYPWQLLGGPGAAYVERIEAESEETLRDYITRGPLGFVAISAADKVFIQGEDVFLRAGIVEDTIPSLTGEQVRDYRRYWSARCVWPYDANGAERQLSPAAERWLWRAKPFLATRATRTQTTYSQAGRRWVDWHQTSTPRIRARSRLLYPGLVTESHFVFDGGGCCPSQSIICIVFADTVDEDSRDAIAAYLNTSSVTAWIKKRCPPTATARGDISVDAGRAESERFQVPGNLGERIPIPACIIERHQVRASLAAIHRRLLQIRDAQEALPGEMRSELDHGEEPEEVFQKAAAKEEDLRRAAVTLQEEADWLVYGAVLSLSVNPLGLDDLWCARAAPEDRPFIAGGSASLESKPLREAWSGRAAIASTDALLREMESANFKRTWSGKRGAFGRFRRSRTEEEADLLRRLLISRLERAWSDGILRVRDVAGIVQSDVVSAKLLEALERREPDATVAGILEGASVPYLAALVWNESGLEKLEEWDRAWEQLRAHDSAILSIADRPREFDRDDYLEGSGWTYRGELGIRTEAFVSYPGCESDEDKEPVYGWAGWNHLQQAQALAELYRKRSNEGWTKERLLPMLAGLLELIPWVKQWHNEPSAEFGGLRLGEYVENFVDGECHTLELTREALRAWRPAGKLKGKKTTAKDAEALDDSEAGEPRPAPKSRGRKKKAATDATET